MKGSWKVDDVVHHQQTASHPVWGQLSRFSVSAAEGQREDQLQVRSQARALDQFSVGCPLDKLTRLRIRLRLTSGQLLLPVPVCSPHVHHMCMCVCVDAIRCRVFCQIYLRFDFSASLQTEVVRPAMSWSAGRECYDLFLRPWAVRGRISYLASIRGFCFDFLWTKMVHYL